MDIIPSAPRGVFTGLSIAGSLMLLGKSLIPDGFRLHLMIMQVMRPIAINNAAAPKEETELCRQRLCKFYKSYVLHLHCKQICS